MPLFQTKERQQYLDFHDLILAYEEVNLFMDTDSTITFQGDYSKLYAYPIGVVDGYSYGDKFDRQKNLNKYKFT